MLTYTDSSLWFYIFNTIFYVCLFLGACRLGVKGVQIPYLRASHRFDFFCLFLALWMDALSLLSACSALARTMSTCLDAMTGGLARMWLLGEFLDYFFCCVCVWVICVKCNYNLFNIFSLSFTALF